MAELRRVPASAPVEDVVRVLNEDGGVIVEELIDARTVAAINREVDGWVETADPAMRHLNPAIQIFFGDRTKHVGGVAGKSRTFATEVMIHPLFLGLCDAILGPSCACYQLNLAHLIVRGPGAEHQYLHRDELVWNLVPRPHPELQLASIVALVDFDDGERRDAGRAGEPSLGARPPPSSRTRSPTPPCAPARRSSTSARPSTAAAPTRPARSWRRGVHISYTLGWLRTEENNYLAVPPAVARTLPRRCQEVLGYAVHDALPRTGGYLGMVSLRDPLELLAEGALDGACK